MNVDYQSIIIGLSTLVLGWILNDIVGQHLRSKKEYRKSINRAIAELLEIRNRAVVLPSYLEQFRVKFNIPNNVWYHIRIEAFNAFGIINDDISTRYDQVIDLISTYDPIMGYKLRSKNIAAQITQFINNAAQLEGANYDHISKTEVFLINTVKAGLEDNILKLSKMLSFVAYHKMKKYLRKSNEVDETVEEFLKMYEAFMPVVEAAVIGEHV